MVTSTLWNSAGHARPERIPNSSRRSIRRTRKRSTTTSTMATCTRAKSFSTRGNPRPMRPSKSSRHTRRPTSRPRSRRSDKSEKSGKADKSDGDAGGKGRKPEKGTAWSRFELGNCTVNALSAALINVHLSKQYMRFTCYTRTWEMRSQCAPSSPNLSHMLTTPFPIHTVHLQAREQNRVFSGASARTWVLAPAHHSGPVCDVNNTVQRLSRPKPPEPEPELPIAMPAVPTAAGQLPRRRCRLPQVRVRRALGAGCAGVYVWARAAASDAERPIAMPAAVPTAAGKLPRWQSRVCRRCVRRAQSGRARWPVGGRAAPGRAVARGAPGAVGVCVCGSASDTEQLSSTPRQPAK